MLRNLKELEHYKVNELEDDLRHEKARHRNDDPHLQSANAVAGYQVHAIDGDIGHVSGFLVDDATWAIRYLIVETGHCRSRSS